MSREQFDGRLIDGLSDAVESHELPPDPLQPPSTIASEVNPTGSLDPPSGAASPHLPSE